MHFQTNFHCNISNFTFPNEKKFQTRNYTVELIQIMSQKNARIRFQGCYIQIVSMKDSEYPSCFIFTMKYFESENTIEGKGIPRALGRYFHYSRFIFLSSSYEECIRLPVYHRGQCVLTYELI